MKTPLDRIQDDLESLTQYIFITEFEFFVDHLLENGAEVLSEEEMTKLEKLSNPSKEDIWFVDSLAADREKSLGHIYGQSYRLWAALLKVQEETDGESR